MTVKLFCCTLVITAMTASSASAALKIQTFDAAPTFEEPEERVDPLPDGGWGVQQDGLQNVDEFDGTLITPFWNEGGGGSGGSNGWLTTVGYETALDNRGPVGPNAEGLAPTAILASVFTGVVVYDETSWGDVSTATHVTMDVKGSFAGSGGITVLVYGEDGFFWSWGAAATNAAVGMNPGDVSEWTNITIPINQPQFQTTPDTPFPTPPGYEGTGGLWGTWQSFLDDQEMSDVWDSVFATVDAIQVVGLTPDSQIDNLGFVLPDVGLPGDFDADTDVDGSDFLVWQQGFGDTHDANDLADWEANFGTAAAVASIGAVPEPSTIGLALVAGCGMLCGRRKHGS